MTNYIYFNRKTVKTIAPPAVSPVSLSDMKSYLRVDTTDDDNLIQDFIDSATVSVKQYIRRALITETFELTADGFTLSNTQSDERLAELGAGMHMTSYSYVLGQGQEMELPFLPIQSITSVKTFDRSNNESTFAASNYELDEQGGRLYLNEGVTFPSNLRAREAVKIVYVAGYGDAASDIPKPIVQTIKQYVSAMYDCRSMCDMNATCKRMLAPYKLVDYLGWV